MLRSKVSSKSLLGVDALINGELHHFNQLQWEYPSKPDVRPAEIAPGLPGFFTLSARARSHTIRWMEQCFVDGSMTIEIQPKPSLISPAKSSMIVTYTHPVESVHERPAGRFQDRLMDRLSASFGFYQARMIKKEAQVRSRLTIAL